MNNKVKTIRVVLEDGQEFDYPAFEHTRITHSMGYESVNVGMFVQNRPNDNRFLIMMSSNDVSVIDNISKLIDDNIPQLINT
jgi:catalase